MIKSLSLPRQVHWRDYLELCKPKVVALMLLTAVVGMLLASSGSLPLPLMLFATSGIACLAGSAACINHLADQRIDVLMARTQHRPLPQGKISTAHAALFALLLAMLGLFLLIVYVNALTAVLTLVSLFGYAVFYTVFLKRATPQNIVIGGAAGAAPPLLGWTAITGTIDAFPLLLFLIIFTWTPPHFWALAIYRYEDYARATVPMLPVTHGIAFTKLYILAYSVLLAVVSLLPYVTHLSGGVYGLAALVLNGQFIGWALRLYRSDENWLAMKLFRFSITYLMLLFCLLLLDHYLPYRYLSL